VLILSWPDPHPEGLAEPIREKVALGPLHWEADTVSKSGSSGGAGRVTIGDSRETVNLSAGALAFGRSVPLIAG